MACIDIQVEMCVFVLRCVFVCATIACALRWRVNLVGDFHY